MLVYEFAAPPLLSRRSSADGSLQLPTLELLSNKSLTLGIGRSGNRQIYFSNLLAELVCRRYTPWHQCMAWITHLPLWFSFLSSHSFGLLGFSA
jgi:hypothetical protein